MKRFWAIYTGGENKLMNNLRTPYMFEFPTKRWVFISVDSIKAQVGCPYRNDGAKNESLWDSTFETAKAELMRKAKKNPETWQFSETDPAIPRPKLLQRIVETVMPEPVPTPPKPVEKPKRK